MTWLVSATIEVAGSSCAWARAADSVSCRCSVSSIWIRLVFGSTFLKTRKGRGGAYVQCREEWLDLCHFLLTCVWIQITRFGF